MRALHLLLLLPAFMLTGCYTSTLAPGAKGQVIDSATGAPLPNAHITRLPFERSIGQQVPAATISSDRHGSFDLPPVSSTQIAFMYLSNPHAMTGTFLVSADGYTTNRLEGVATSRSRWRARLGSVTLERL